MEAVSRGKLAALIEELLRRGAGFDLFQALQLAESAGRPGGDGNARVRLRPAAEISFPAADLRRCRLDGAGRLAFEINLLGLYGVDSPLPSYFLEAAAGEEETALPLRRFLDIFADRLYRLLYEGWKRHRPAGSRRRGLFEAYLDAFAGTSGRFAAAETRSYAALFGRRIRSADGLAGMLGDHLGAPVTVRSFHPRWVRVDQPSSLGGAPGPALGEDALLGERVLDCSRQIDIRVGPLDFEAARSLLPGQPSATALRSLIRRYLPRDLDFELDLLIHTRGGELPLGKECRLGWTPLLAGDAERIITIRLTDPQAAACTKETP